jgi:hypothetical protein
MQQVLDKMLLDLGRKRLHDLSWLVALAVASETDMMYSYSIFLHFSREIDKD